MVCFYLQGENIHFTRNPNAVIWIQLTIVSSSSWLPDYWEIWGILCLLSAYLGTNLNSVSPQVCHFVKWGVPVLQDSEEMLYWDKCKMDSIAKVSMSFKIHNCCQAPALKLGCQSESHADVSVVETFIKQTYWTDPQRAEEVKMMLLLSGMIDSRKWKTVCLIESRERTDGHCSLQQGQVIEDHTVKWEQGHLIGLGRIWEASEAWTLGDECSPYEG